MFGLFLTIFSEGYVDRKRYSCNSLGNRKRQSALIFELYKVKGPCCSMSICVITISHCVYKSFEQLRNSIKLIVSIFTLLQKTVDSKSVQFSFLILLFSEGYVDHKSYSCNGLGKQIRQSGQNCERVPGEMSMLFNMNLYNHDHPVCV